MHLSRLSCPSPDPLGADLLLLSSQSPVLALRQIWGDRHLTGSLSIGCSEGPKTGGVEDPKAGGVEDPKSGDAEVECDTPEILPLLGGVGGFQIVTDL